MTDKLYGHALNGEIVAFNSQGGYDATDPTVRHLWEEVPAGTERGATLVDGVWTNPPPASPTRKRVIDANEFTASFTAFEEVAIRDFAGGAKSDDTATIAMQRKVVAVFLARLERASNVNLDLQANIDGMAFLKTCGLLTQARVTEILAGPLA